jgi:hypothetical protein
MVSPHYSLREHGCSGAEMGTLLAGMAFEAYGPEWALYEETRKTRGLTPGAAYTSIGWDGSKYCAHSRASIPFICSVLYTGIDGTSSPIGPHRKRDGANPTCRMMRTARSGLRTRHCGAVVGSGLAPRSRPLGGTGASTAHSGRVGAEMKLRA